MRQPVIGNVCHFPPPPGGMPVLAEALTSDLRGEGLGVVPIPTNLRGNAILRFIDGTRFLRSFARLPVFLWRLARSLPKVDILHVHACSGLSFFLFASPSLCAARWFGKRAVLHYHGGNARGFFANWPRVIPWVLRHTDAIVVPSEYLRDLFAEMGFPSRMIPNVVSVERFAAPDRGPLRPVFVVARNLEPVYNVACILRAFARVRAVRPDAFLYVLGGGTEEQMLKALTAELGLSGAVEFLGYVNNAEIPQVFRKASVFLNASISDNQPVSILEAFAAELPVITSDAGGIPLLVRHGETGLLFPVNDHEALAERIEFLLAHPELAREMTGNAKQVVARHAWPAVFAQLAGIYGIRVAEKEPAGAHQ